MKSTQIYKFNKKVDEKINRKIKKRKVLLNLVVDSFLKMGCVWTTFTKTPANPPVKSKPVTQCIS